MSKSIVILDYGSGNIRSAEKSLAKVGAKVSISSDYETCLNADGLVIPGVGAFESCMQGIKKVKGQEIVDKRLAGSRCKSCLRMGLNMELTLQDYINGQDL